MRQSSKGFGMQLMEQFLLDGTETALPSYMKYMELSGKWVPIAITHGALLGLWHRDQTMLTSSDCRLKDGAMAVSDKDGQNLHNGATQIFHSIPILSDLSNVGCYPLQLTYQLPFRRLHTVWNHPWGSQIVATM
eukprot:4901061-Amphidinium_carterae.1